MSDITVGRKKFKNKIEKKINRRKFILLLSVPSGKNEFYDYYVKQNENNRIHKS